MIDSTNPRVMADNIRHLTAAIGAHADELEKLGNISTDEFDTGKKYGNDIIYGKIFEVESLPNNTTSSMAHNISNLKDVFMLHGIAKNASNSGFPIDYRNIVYLGYSATNITIACSGDFSSYSAIIYIEYTKSAPSSLTSPAPDDSRSIEPEVREEAPEEEPIEAEPIEEPVVEVKKTTRKKTTTNE